jgi:plastocyanin
VSPHRATTLLAVLAAASLALGACGGDDDSDAADATCNEVADGEVTIAAEDLAWEPTCLSGPADEPFTIVIDNRDDGVNHNLHLTDAPDEPATKLEPGPGTQELEVTLPAGDYELVCDIHPNMVGTLEVAAAAAEG